MLFFPERIKNIGILFIKKGLESFNMNSKKNVEFPIDA